ncbi:hypothetical protein B0H11DRAFT_1920389 [Mycena galericulata]|nr:hypothetical protein B0H11DRAFT_1920389 [Mycena galericulata]
MNFLRSFLSLFLFQEFRLLATQYNGRKTVPADFLEHATTLVQHIAAYYHADPGSLIKINAPPAYWNNNGVAFVKLPDTIWPDDAYRAVVFGQDWSQKGWPDSTLLDAYTSEFSPLSETYWEDRNGDLDNSRYPVVWKWSDGLKLIVDIDSQSPLEYLLPSADGDLVRLEGIQDYTMFPFAIGDTLIAEVTLHLWEKEFSSKDHRHEYSLRLRFLKITVCVSPVPLYWHLQVILGGGPEGE